MHIPFFILDTISEIVFRNIESYLLGITLAVLLLLDDEMETEIHSYLVRILRYQNNATIRDGYVFDDEISSALGF